jgi:hypothetical protein
MRGARAEARRVRKTTMLGYVLHYPGRAMRALATDPIGLWDTFHDRLVERREYKKPTPRYDADADWERRLHRILGAPWPCEAHTDFRARWPLVVGDVMAKGVDVGPESFNGYNDGDGALVRAIWCLVRHLRPWYVVETGVAHGFTSRFILEALERNGEGELHSIDLPPLDPAMRAQIGIAVDERLRDRWTLHEGSSRRVLPGLLKSLGGIDLFVHDSRHTERNVRFELDRAWAMLRPGGAIVVDDIDSNWGFESFRREHPGNTSFVCNAEPVRPDRRRFNQRGQFGIILKGMG